MDYFVREKLKEWGLSELIEHFQEHRIDKESLFNLDDSDICNLITIIGLRSKFKRGLKLLKEQNATNQDSATGDTSEKGKRRLQLQGESSRMQTPAKKRRDTTFSEKTLLREVKTIMAGVTDKLRHRDNSKLNDFLKRDIANINAEKKKLVGVFGKTGAGKSSLINAIIGEKDLLPTGSVTACTTVMIKVEANMKNQKYEAEIEFISKEEWKEDLWFYSTFIVNDTDDEDRSDDDYKAAVEMLSAVYGEDWRNVSPEKLMNEKYFREIREFLSSMKKTLSCESAKELSAKLVKYTRSLSEERRGDAAMRWFWPLVKCVTVKVPNNDFLEHVTLVDLPGNGDRNKSRDNMWKRVVESCSTVWIVADINRAVAEKESWEILESASSHMGNGGQCQQIHFICTKSDVVEDLDELPAAAIYNAIFKRNMLANDAVRREFRGLNKTTKHFSDECFQVFTVSAKEFQKKKCLNAEETEIPKLQEYLQNLSDRHSETLNFVSGAHGILSLIQGARQGGMDGEKAAVSRELKGTLRDELEKVSMIIQKALQAFEKCLNKGVENSQKSCERDLKTFLYPKTTKGRGFHRTLKCVVVSNGVHKTQKGKQLNLNMTLASWLTDSIDEEFRKTFPNDSKCGPFNGAISNFSLNTEKLVEKRKGVELQLTFLRTEEERIKTEVNKTIQERKKEIYRSLTETVEETMQPCYDEAKQITGTGSLEKMRETIDQHVHAEKDTMFKRAKDVVLSKLQTLKDDIWNTLVNTMADSIDLSLSADDQSLPDVSEDLEFVKACLNKLQKSTDDTSDHFSADQPGPSTAQVW